MKKLFIHKAIFRLLSPVIIGIVVYLLVLLVNNNVSQLQEQFLNEELYFFVALSFIIQELSRFSLLLLEQWEAPSIMTKIIGQIALSLLVSVVIVYIAVDAYFNYILKFAPSSTEFTLFISIFSGITLIYVLIYVSHYFLFKINAKKMAVEQLLKEEVEEDFNQFTRGINPKLLYESLESIIVLLYTEKGDIDESIDNLSSIYRYILSGKERELSPFNDEWKVVKELIQIFDRLPYRKVSCTLSSDIQAYVVSGGLLKIVETIIRSSIIIPDNPLNIFVKEIDNYIQIEFKSHQKIDHPIGLNDFLYLNNSYKVYSNLAIQWKESDDGSTHILLPKLIKSQTD